MNYNKIGRNKNILLWLSVLLLLFPFGCADEKPEATGKKREFSLPVHIGKVVYLDVMDQVRTVGNIQAEQRVVINTEVAGGEWKFSSKLPKDGWTIKFRELSFRVQPTGFGHIGMFPEQAPNWNWIEEQIKSSDRKEINLINIFGYTGASTLAAASAGAAVTHVDASKASVTWARKNMELSGLGDKPVRWIVDDALIFLKREHKRGRRYDGIIMDPPTFGRGPKGEVWKIEDQLSDLMIHCRQVLSDQPLLILLTTHSPGFSALTLKNMVIKFLVEPGSGTFETDEMYIHDTGSGLHLPNGFYSRWSNGTGK